MAEDPIFLLEERVKALEMKIFGQLNLIPETSTPIVDSLLESQKVISSALSGRDKMVAAVKHLDLLETTLDPMYEDSVLDSAAKLAFILSMEHELGEITRQLVRINELSPCLGSEQLRNIPLLMQQLGRLTTITVQNKKKCDLMQGEIDDLITEYTEVINAVTSVFATLDNIVTEMEIKAQPKEIIE